jgi:hypothetical protein
MGNVSGLRLQKKQKVAVSLGFVVIREDAFFHFAFFEMTSYFVLLREG